LHFAVKGESYANKLFFDMRSDNYTFNWADIGDIDEGRPNLGCLTNVAVYRLMQYTLRSVLNRELGGEKAAEMFYSAGHLAGREFCRNMLDVSIGFSDFAAQLQSKLKELKIGVLRLERTDLEKLELTLVVTEDLDCSGLPVTDETVCDYDEGFIAGILEEYTGKKFDVDEVDCWSKGDRVCRFEAKLS
jgi:Predicted hydrocarbon binding protein (contains V4R domain)